MARIRILNKDGLQSQIKKAINRKMNLVFNEAKDLLLQQAKVYRDKFANSSEYQDIKSRMVGEFGFTPEEVAGLDRILDLLVPSTDNDITVSFITTGIAKSTKFMILEWVDFSKLKEHPIAQHELTKLDAAGSVIGITDIVSWIEWLEEGETIRGYEFFKSNESMSRSGAGLMRRDTGNIFVLEPTRIFERIGIEANINVLRRGFGILVKKFGKS